MFTVESCGEGEWRVLRDGQLYLRLAEGGTGPCWNVGNFDDADYPFHVCDLDDLIAALTVLRDHDAHRANVARWAP